MMLAYIIAFKALFKGIGTMTFEMQKYYTLLCRFFIIAGIVSSIWIYESLQKKEKTEPTNSEKIQQVFNHAQKFSYVDFIEGKNRNGANQRHTTFAVKTGTEYIVYSARQNKKNYNMELIEYRVPLSKLNGAKLIGVNKKFIWFNNGFKIDRYANGKTLFQIEKIQRIPIKAPYTVKPKKIMIKAVTPTSSATIYQTYEIKLKGDKK